MVFYNDHKGLIVQQEERPNEDKAYILVNEIKNLRKLDIKNFNYYLFNSDLDLMSNKEFEWWYRVAFEPWFFDLQEDYLDIDYEEIQHRFESPEAKKLFTKKIVYFVMFYFPYQIVRDIIKRTEVKNISELIETLNSPVSLLGLREDIALIIERNLLNTEDFVTALVNFEKIAKKNQLDKSVILLDELVQNQNTFISIFKDIIYESDMEKILNLLEVYRDSDEENIS